MSNLLVELYRIKNCTMCKDARSTLNRVIKDIPFSFKEVNIEANDELKRKYAENVPTIFINGKKAFKFKLDEDQFRERVRKEIIKSGLNKYLEKEH